MRSAWYCRITCTFYQFLEVNCCHAAAVRGISTEGMELEMIFLCRKLIEGVRLGPTLSRLETGYCGWDQAGTGKAGRVVAPTYNPNGVALSGILFLSAGTPLLVVRAGMGSSRTGVWSPGEGHMEDAPYFEILIEVAVHLLVYRAPAAMWYSQEHKDEVAIN